MNDKPLSDLIPSLPNLKEEATALVELHAPPLRSPLPPINLPSFTFLIGEPKDCFQLVTTLEEQSQFIYIEDFLSPIYSMIQALHDLPMTMTEAEIADKYPVDVHQLHQFVVLRGYSLEDKLFSRIEEVTSYSDYQFVIRDAKGFDLSKFDQTYGKGVLHLPIGMGMLNTVEEALQFLRTTYK